MLKEQGTKLYIRYDPIYILMGIYGCKCLHSVDVDVHVEEGVDTEISPERNIC